MKPASPRPEKLESYSAHESPNAVSEALPAPGGVALCINTGFSFSILTDIILWL